MERWDLSSSLSAPKSHGFGWSSTQGSKQQLSSENVNHLQMGKLLWNQKGIICKW
jgi:hypothetical protein